MNDSFLVKFFGKSPNTRIIDFFLDNKLLDFTKKEIYTQTRMGYLTFKKAWKDLESFRILKMTRRIGNAKLYKLDKDSIIIKKLLELESSLVI